MPIAFKLVCSFQGAKNKGKKAQSRNIFHLGCDSHGTLTLQPRLLRHLELSKSRSLLKWRHQAEIHQSLASTREEEGGVLRMRTKNLVIAKIGHIRPFSGVQGFIRCSCLLG